MKKLIILIAIATTLFSCRKRYDNDPSVLMNYKVATAFDEMTNISDQAMSGDLVYYKSTGSVIYTKPGEIFSDLKEPCSVVITLDTTVSPKILTVDYGDVNCDCNDGKSRRGKIITTFDGSYLNVGTIITHITDNYYVNDLKIDGTKTVENMGLNTDNQPYYWVQIDGVATEMDGEEFIYTSSRERTWVAGYNTLINRWDDEYTISGTSTGSFSSGGGFSSNTINPILIKIGCPYPVSGSLQITPMNKPDRIIDYGSGTCDNTFTVTVNGHTFTIN